MPTGKVKWFNVEKGFGFITPSDGTKDVFVHRRSVNALGRDEGLEEGESVQYEIEETPKGLNARNVERIRG